MQFVSRQLGHTKTSTTWDTYVHLFEAHRHAHDAREQLEGQSTARCWNAADAYESARTLVGVATCASPGW